MDAITKEALQAIQAAARRRLARRGDMPLTDAGLCDLINEALDPAAFTLERPASPRQLEIPREYPKLKTLYDVKTGEALEQIVVHTIYEELPYMSSGKDRPGTRWFTRPLSELKQLERDSR